MKAIVSEPSSATVADASQWVAMYGDMLFRYAVTRVYAREIAEDIVQDTFLSAYSSLDKFKAESSEKTWLFSILKNKIIDHYRKKKTIFIETDDSEEQHDDFFEGQGHWDQRMVPHEWADVPSQEVERKEFQLVLQRCMGKLPEQQRTIFTLKYLEDESSDKICKELSINASNYWVVIHRAKLLLRQCLEKNWFEKNTPSYK